MDQKNHNGQSGVFDQGHRNNKGLEMTPVSRGVSFVIRKTEKLTTALYMVTDIMSEKDPMKWKVREIGVDILSDITVSANASPSERMSVFRNVMRKIERVVSFLDIAQSAQMMSEMNASVLKKEYLALRDAIEAEWHHVYDDGKRLLSGAFSEEKHAAAEHAKGDTLAAPVATQKAPEPAPAPAPAPVPATAVEAPRQEISPAPVEEPAPAPFVIKQEKPQPVMVGASAPKLHLERLHVETPERRPLPTSRPVFEAPRPRVAEVREDTSFGRARSDGDRDDRRKIILALIKQKPSLTVKDIVKSIPQVSEKTIQRELLAMVAEGILLKKGERRWSTYSLREE
jgi:hypothetical protein